MIVNKSTFLYLLIVVFSFVTAIAQDKQLIPLENVIKSLEKRLGIVFSYHDDNVKDIFIEVPDKNLTLTEVLAALRNRTGLKFKKLNERFITVYNSRSTKIQICGYIKDEETKNPVVGAVVYSNDNYVISNELGHFEISLDFKIDSVITIQHVGYVPKQTVQTKWTNECKDYYLIQEIVKLNEVVVNNYLTKGINKMVDGSIQLNIPFIVILPGLTEPDVLYTIQALPGILSIDETVSNINIRGGTNDQNLILWDGVRVYQSGHFFGLISAINPYFVEQTTLIKNGTSAYFGDGVSGTIDTRIDDRVIKNFQSSAGLNLINADVELKIPLTNKISVLVGARRSISDIIVTPTYKQYFNRAFRDTEITNPSNTIDSILKSNENFKFYDINLKFLYDISRRDKIRMSLFNFSNSIDYEESELVNNSVETKISGLNQTSLILNLSYNRLWNKKLKTSAFSYVSQYKLNALNFDILKAQRLIQENDVVDFGFKISSRYVLNSNFDIFSGYQFSVITITNIQNITNPYFEITLKNALTAHTLFFDGNLISNTKKINLRFGLRANYFEKFGRFLFEPRLAYNHKFLNVLSFEILAEAKSQTTTQIIDSQDDFLGLENRRWILSNEDDIPVIQSAQLSFGVHYQKNDLLVTLEGYYKRVNGIISSSQGFQNQHEFIRSTGSYNVYGMDVLINKRFSNANIWVSYSYAENTFFFKEFIPSTFPNNLDITHTLTLGTSYNIKHLELSTGINYRTGKPFTKPLNINSIVDNHIIYNSPNSSRIDPYLRLDLSVKYRFSLSNNVETLIGISVWNVLNKKNIVNVHYHINEADEIEQINQEALGIVPKLNIRVIF